MTCTNDKRLWMWLSAVVFACGCQPLKDERSDSNEDRDADAAMDEGSAGDDGPSSRAGNSGSRAGTSGSRSGAGSGGAGGSAADGGTRVVENDGTLNCLDRVPARVTQEVSGTMSGNIQWSGVVHVKGDFSLRGAGTKLTIEAGTQIFVDPERLVEIGWNSSEHAIDAQGTERAPIKFCRSNKTALAWKGIDIGPNVESSSVLEHVVIEGAGAMEGSALVLRKGILIDHVSVRDSAGHGVEAADFRDDSASLTVTTSKLAPLVLTDAWAVEHLPDGGTFTGNTVDVARLTFANVTIGTTFREIGIPYQLDRGLSLRTGGKLVVEPGVEWQVGVDQGIEFGWNSSQTELHLDGTADEPIVIRGVDARPGSWLGAAVQKNVASTSTMKFVKVLHGGGRDGYGMVFSAAITATDLTFEKNGHGGFAIGEAGLNKASARFTATGNAGMAGSVEAGALSTFPAGGSFKGNESDWIEVDGGNITLSGTIPEIDVPFRVLETVTIRNGAAVTIAAGADFQMQNGVTWDVGWNGTMATITAVGTAAKPIKFRGVQDQPGFWNGMWIGRNVATTSRLEHVQIGNGGADASLGGNLRLASPITVTSCRLYGSSRFGLVAPMEYTQAYETSNEFESNAMGDVERE